MKRLLVGILATAVGAWACAQGGARIFGLPEAGPASDGPARLQFRVDDTKRNPAKISPLHGWTFDWIVAAYARPAGSSDPSRVKFRIYSQFRKAENDLSPRVARMLLRLWDMNYNRLGFDHSVEFRGLVDVYLCFGGKAGGEQRFDVETENNVQNRVNTIYIYDVTSFTDPVEMAREVAHEYGHATLPAVGTYKAPEDWANGYLGEKLFMTWLHRELVAKRLEPADVMGASATGIQAYLTANVDPLWRNVRDKGPDFNLLAGTSAAAMDAYIGVALWAERILPEAAFSRSLVLNTDGKAPAYTRTVVSALEEVGTLKLTDKIAVGSTVFLPEGKGKWSGAKRLSVANGWGKFLVQSKTLQYKCDTTALD